MRNNKFITNTKEAKESKDRTFSVPESLNKTYNTSPQAKDKKNKFLQIEGHKLESDVTVSRRSDVGSTQSTNREDSILLHAKNELSSPTPSDVESGVSQTSKFFNIFPCNDDTGTQFSISESKDELKKALDKGNQFRLKANILFKKNKFKDALGEYLHAVGELKSLIESNKKHELLNMTNINWVKMECLNSISVCYLLLKDYAKVLQYTDEALNINSHNFIALSYRAKALIALKCLKEALDVVKVALTVKYSKSLIVLLKEIEEKMKVELDEEKRRLHLINAINGINTYNGGQNLNLHDEIINSYTTIINHSDGDEKEDKNKNKNTDRDLKNTDKDRGRGKDEIEKDEKRNFKISFLKSIFKFLKIFSIGLFEYLRKYKLGLLLLLLIYIIVFRRRLKNKLFSMLRIKFN